RLRPRPPTACAAGPVPSRHPSWRARRPGLRLPPASPGGDGEGPLLVADVLGRRADDLVVAVLLVDVRRPAHDAAGGEERRVEILVDPEVAVERARVEIDVGPE